jgi:hypothetical protein
MMQNTLWKFLNKYRYSHSHHSAAYLYKRVLAGVRVAQRFGMSELTRSC